VATTTNNKKQLISKYGKCEADTGSASTQIAILTESIRNLTAHLQIHTKDFGSRRGLLRQIGKRRRLQSYLRRTNPKEYAELIKNLGLRR
jgi:small subunit ribosomal protein S15